MTTAEKFNGQNTDQARRQLVRESDTGNRAFFDTYFVRPALPDWTRVSSMHERVVDKNLRASTEFTRLGAYAEAMQTAYAAAMTPKVGLGLTDRALEAYKANFQALKAREPEHALELLKMNRNGVMVYGDKRNQGGMDDIAGDTLFGRFVSETADLFPGSGPKLRVRPKVSRMSASGQSGLAAS